MPSLGGVLEQGVGKAPKNNLELVLISRVIL